MKKVSINTAQERYDNMTPPDDSEYEKKKEAFLICKDLHLKQMIGSVFYSNCEDAISAVKECIEVIIAGEAPEFEKHFFEFAEYAMEWKAEQFAKEETGFEP